MLAQAQVYANAAIALHLVSISFDVMLVGNAVLGILIFLARAYAKNQGFLVKTDEPTL